MDINESDIRIALKSARRIKDFIQSKADIEQENEEGNSAST